MAITGGRRFGRIVCAAALASVALALVVPAAAGAAALPRTGGTATRLDDLEFAGHDVTLPDDTVVTPGKDRGFYAEASDAAGNAAGPVTFTRIGPGLLVPEAAPNDPGAASVSVEPDPDDTFDVYKPPGGASGVILRTRADETGNGSITATAGGQSRTITYTVVADPSAPTSIDLRVQTGQVAGDTETIRSYPIHGMASETDGQTVTYHVSGVVTLDRTVTTTDSEPYAQVRFPLPHAGRLTVTAVGKGGYAGPQTRTVTIGRQPTAIREVISSHDGHYYPTAAVTPVSGLARPGSSIVGFYRLLSGTLHYVAQDRIDSQGHATFAFPCYAKGSRYTYRSRLVAQDHDIVAPFSAAHTVTCV